MPGLHAEFDAVMATLGATAVIAGLDQCAVGSVAAWAHGRGDRLHIGAGFRVDPAGQPRHPIRGLLPQCQATPAGTVFFVEIPVWVEDLIDTAGDGFDDLGIVLGGFAHEAALHLVAICDRHTRRQQVDGPADHPQMILTDFTGLHRGGDMRQRRRQGWAGQLAARSDARGHLHPAFDLSGRDTQPPGQAVHHRRHHRGLIGRIGDLTEHPIHQPAVAALLGLELLGHLRPELVAHLITGPAADLGVSGLHLIGQRAKPLTRRLPSHESSHTPTLSTTTAKQDSPNPTLTESADEVRTVDNSRERPGFVGGRC